ADFGFAKASEQMAAPVSASQLSTRTLSSPTASILPLAASYLAPEQFEGTETGARADIFAFGAVLYEMLAGRPAFEGKTSAMLLAAIHTVDPEPVSQFQPAVPPALEYVVKQCLAKDPSHRFQTTRDLVSHLIWISEGSGRIGLPAGAAKGRRKRDRLLWIGAAALILLTASIAPSAYRYFEGAPDLGEVRFNTSMPGTS